MNRTREFSETPPAPLQEREKQDPIYTKDSDLLTHYRYLQDSAEKYHRYRLGFTTLLLALSGASISFFISNQSDSLILDVYISITVTIIGFVGWAAVSTTHANIEEIERKSIAILKDVKSSPIPFIEKPRHFGNRSIPRRKTLELNFLHKILFWLVILFGLILLSTSIWKHYKDQIVLVSLYFSLGHAIFLASAPFMAPSFS